MSTQLQLRRDTADNWVSNNPTLAAGEYGFETDVGRVKLGDGSLAWNSLPYIGGGDHVICLSSTNTLTSQTGVQPIFDGGGGPTNGRVTLPVGTYQFECLFSLSSMSSTSGSFGFALGGTATFTQGWWAEAQKAVLATASSSQSTYNTAANTAIATASTATTAYALIRGIIRVTTAGTIIPQVSLGVAAAAVVGANSYFRATPLGMNGASAFVSVGNWS